MATSTATVESHSDDTAIMCPTCNCSLPCPDPWGCTKCPLCGVEFIFLVDGICGAPRRATATASTTTQLQSAEVNTYKSLLMKNYRLLSRSLVVTDALVNDLAAAECLERKLTAVEQQTSPQMKVDKLLTILRSVPQQHIESVFNELISALRQDGQEHVANIFLPNSDARPMSDEHYQLLVNRQQQLCESLDPLNGLIKELVARNVFSHTDTPSDDATSREVYDVLLRKRDSAFDAFIGALCATKQVHVASLLGYETADIPMTGKHRQLLSEKTNEITTFMDPCNDLIDKLVTAGVFGDNDEKQIQNKSGTDAKCRLFVDILLRKPDSAFETFIGALCATKQAHVASLLGHECSEKPMTEEHRQLLISKREELGQFIDPNFSLLNSLVAVDVFGRRDTDSVVSKPSYIERSNEVVNILLRKSDSSFEKFIEALNSTEQQHVVHILTGQGESPLSRVRRLVLRKARDRLLNRVDIKHTSLIAKLISSGVLTDEDKQRIEKHDVNEDRTAALIDVMARKSQLSYDKFIQALKDSGHSKIAAELEGLELRGIINPRFLSDIQPAERSRIVQVLRNNMQALVSGKGDGIEELTSLMEQNGYAVSEILEGSILISFKCFTEESLVNLERLYTDKTLDKLFTQVFCSQFFGQGLESLEIHISDGQFEKCFETFGKIEADSQRLSAVPLELLELVLMRTFIKLFNDHYKSQYKTHEAIRLAYSTVAVVCYNWWQTMNGWPQSTTKHWLRHKLQSAAKFVCRPYGVSPRLQFSLPMLRDVCGVTVCDNKLFAVCRGSKSILVFGPNGKEQTDIELQQLTYPLDIVSCTETQQLFVSDSSCVLRVSLDGRQIVNWLPNKSTTTTRFRLTTLSVTSRRLLVTLPHNNELSLYGADGVELKRISFSDMTSLQHAVETSRGTFIVSHLKPQPRVCEVNVDGHVTRVYCDQQQLSFPGYLSLDFDGRIFVADYNKHRVLLLTSETLELERVLLDSQQHQLIQWPWRMCYTQQTRQLAVGSRLSGCVQLFTLS